MSALGDYIHLYTSHYLDHGTKRKTGSNEPNYSMDIINNRITTNVKPINLSAISELERKLKLNSDLKENQELTKAEEQRQRLIDICYQLLYERSQRIDGIKRVAKVAKGGEIFSKGGKKIALGDQTWAAHMTHAQLKQLSEKANAIYREIQKLINKINNTYGPYSYDDFTKLVSLFNEYTHLAKDPDSSTMGEILRALKVYRYKGAVNEISGNFGEMMVAICDDACNDLAEEQVKKVITEAIVGQQRTAIRFNKNLISTGYNFMGTNPDDQNQYSLGSTQNKVDVRIKINDENVYASVKTSQDVSKNPRPKLQEVNLLVSLTFLNSYPGLEDFGNHWLNMHVMHMSHNKQKTLDEILKKEIAYEALSSGNPFKQNVESANVFVYINRANGKVYVQSVQKLLDDMDRIGGLKEIPQLHFKNERQDETWQRINDILAQVHATKLQVAMNIIY